MSTEKEKEDNRNGKRALMLVIYLYYMSIHKLNMNDGLDACICISI